MTFGLFYGAEQTDPGMVWREFLGEFIKTYLFLIRNISRSMENFIIPFNFHFNLFKFPVRAVVFR